jgi:hypothetical protein
MRITVNFVVVYVIVLVATTSVIHAADADNEKLVGEVSCYVPNLSMICRCYSALPSVFCSIKFCCLNYFYTVYSKFAALQCKR